MVGPFVNGAALLIGSLLGGFIGPRFSKDFKSHMPMVFGCTSIGIAVSMIIKGNLFAPIALAVILGAVVGEIIHFENGIQRGVSSSVKFIEKFLKPSEHRDQQDLLDKFVPLTVLFCFSGMGFYGSLQEGMTGDPTLLIVKSILDLFTSLIFASTIGYSLAILCIPQTIVQILLFSGATLIVPFTTPEMLGDFSACGGIILLAVGLRICGIKNLPVANMVPALFLVMPLSLLWSKYLS